MDNIQLPALSGLNKPELQAAYTKETGKEPGELTVEALRAALTEHRAAHPAPAAQVAAVAPSRQVPTITVVDNETQLEQELTEAVWKELGPAQANYTLKADKPAELG